MLFNAHKKVSTGEMPIVRCVCLSGFFEEARRGEGEGPYRTYTVLYRDGAPKDRGLTLSGLGGRRKGGVAVRMAEPLVQCTVHTYCSLDDPPS